VKAGTLVRLPDGREGRVVYHNLDGYGIIWGSEPLDAMVILAGDGPAPEAKLRAPYEGQDEGVEYVGDDYEIVEESPQ
jgi:hypothetical protein